MRNLIFGIIGVLWGGLILLSAILRGTVGSTQTAYSSGNLAGTIFGVLLLLGGIYALLKWNKQRKQPKDTDTKP